MLWIPSPDTLRKSRSAPYARTAARDASLPEALKRQDKLPTVAYGDISTPDVQLMFTILYLTWEQESIKVHFSLPVA